MDPHAAAAHRDFCAVVAAALLANGAQSDRGLARVVCALYHAALENGTEREWAEFISALAVLVERIDAPKLRQIVDENADLLTQPAYRTELIA